MENDKKAIEGCWISLILRLAVASIFTATAVEKFRHGFAGLDGIVTFFQNAFKDTWLPLPLVRIHARIVPFAEALIPIWLIVGVKLRFAWVFTAFFMTTLAFGMMVAKEYATAASNYLYVLISCAGLYFSQFDRLSADGCCSPKCD